MLQNKYPLNFINFCTKTFLDKGFINKASSDDKTQEANQDEFIITLPFLGNVSNIIRKKLKKLWSKNFQPTHFQFFFDDLFRSQISPRFQKTHLENRVMSSKMWKSDFLRFWYTFTWPQGSDLAKIRLFDLWISKYSGKSQKKSQKKKSENFFRSKKYFFSDVYYRQIFYMSSLWT